MAKVCEKRFTKEEEYQFFKERGWVYNPINGDVHSPTGKLWNNTHKDGYILLVEHYIVNGKRLCINIRAHRYAWYFMFNTLPDEVDHEDQIKHHNWIKNLRDVTHSENHFNIEHKGCWYNKKTRKWCAVIKLNQKVKSLGCFLEEADARKAYLEAKKIYHVIKNRKPCVYASQG